MKEEKPDDTLQVPEPIGNSSDTGHDRSELHSPTRDQNYNIEDVSCRAELHPDLH